MATEARVTRRAAAASLARDTRTRGRAPGQNRLTVIVVHLLLIAGVVVMIAPFVWMLLGSLKPFSEFLQSPPPWLPQHPTVDNYDNLFNKLDFPQYFSNSMIVAGLVTGGNLLFCSMLGYALAKLKFPGRQWIFRLVLATLMVPGAVIVVPLFVLMSMLGFVNSYAGLVLPFLAGPFGVFLMRQFMLGIPDELLEAARIDGAGEYRIFLQIAMPIATPALATLGILTFLASWNNFLWPLIVATNDSMYTLPVALATFSTGQHQADYGLLMAGSAVLAAPVVVIFLLLQRYFIEGIATTGLKG